MALTPEQRSMRARIAAHARWGKEDPRTATKPARDAFLAKFEREVDPNNQLPPQERARRAESLRRAHMTRLALLSSKARKAAA